MWDRLLTGNPHEIAKNAVKGAIFAGGSLVGAALLTGLCAMVGANLQERVMFPVEAAKLEQFRADLAQVRCEVSAQVNAQALELNQKITMYQAQNARWYLDILAPDGWNRIQPLTLPCGEE